MLLPIIAIIGGIIAASSLIVSKKPNAQELIDKLTPYQGGIGIVLLIYSIPALLRSITSTSIIGIAISAAMFIVGFLLGFSLISKYLLEKNEEAKAKGEKLRMSLAKYQVPAGIVLIVLGIISFF